MKIEGLELSGDDATIVADLTDPFAKMKVDGGVPRPRRQVRHLPRAGPRLRPRRSTAAPARSTCTNFGFDAPGGGKFGLERHLDTNRLALNAGLRFTDFHTESYVPARAARDGGRQAAGPHRRARRPAAQSRRAWAAIDLQFSRPKANGLPREVKIGGSASHRARTASRPTG